MSLHRYYAHLAVATGRCLVGAWLLIGLFASAVATTFEDPEFVEETITRPDGKAWSGVVGLQFVEDGSRAFAWEREGRVWIIDEGNPVTVPFVDITDEVLAWRDHGLLGFALDPRFDTNGYFYLYYAVDRHFLEHCSEPAAGVGRPECDVGYDPDFSIAETRATIGRVSRYQARQPDGEGDYANAVEVDYSTRKVILGEVKSSACPVLGTTHGVGALNFGTDGTLLASCGDSAGPGGVDTGGGGPTAWVEAINEGIIRPEENVGAYRAQMLNSHNGKLLRLDPVTGDGVPSNPFFDPANPRSAASRVWTLGVRNPFRTTLRPDTGSHDPADGDPGSLYVGDVGWRTWEDFHVVQKGGENLGWPAFEGIERQQEYWQAAPFNQDAPNPLASAATGCPDYLRFTSLIQQKTDVAEPSWPNPCDSSQAITSAATFMHETPMLDWLHGVARTRFPAVDASGLTVPVGIGQVGFDGTTVDGIPFEGNSSTGGTWYRGTDFPVRYQNTYFHGDYGAQWVRHIVMDESDRPVALRPFLSDAGGVVFITTNPVSGGLYYISWASEIRRVIYAPGGNRPPEAIATAEPHYGTAPLSVTFDASASRDPEGTALSYRWDFGDGSQSTAGPVVVHSFDPGDANARGYEINLTVTDLGGSSDTLKLLVSANNTPPIATITSPADDSQYSTSSETTVPLNADLSDDERDILTLRCRWQLVFHHNTHTHNDPPLLGCQQTTVLSPTECTTETFWYAVHLEVTDPGGLTTRTSSNVYPDCGGTAPLANPDTAFAQVGGSVVIPVLLNDTADGSLNPHSVVLATEPTVGVASVDVASGEIAYRHTGTQTVTDQLAYRVRDNLGNRSNLATVTISVSGTVLNQPPVLDLIGDRSVTAGDTLRFSLSAEDGDGPLPLTLAASGLPTGAVLENLGGGSGLFSWTTQPGDESTSPHEITFAATDGAGAEDRETIRINVSAPLVGDLTANVTAPTGTADLSAEGGGDWVKWAYTSKSSVDRMAGVAPAIANFTPINLSPRRFNASSRLAYTWNNGTPTPSAFSRSGLYVSGAGEGYELSATADTDSRLLILYLGGWKASANLEVSLSDASAQPLVINLSDLTGAFDRRVAINYSAGRDNERLILRYVMTGGRGNVTLQAAAMQGGGPLSNLPPVLDPIGDQAVLENQTLAFGVSARDDDGPAPLSLSASGLPPGASFSDLGGGNGQFTWTPVAGDATPAPYQLTFAATDGADASTGESIEIRVNGVSSGGSLTSTVTTPTGSANLTAEGSADWLHLALSGATSVNRKAGVMAAISYAGSIDRVANRFNAPNRLTYSWNDGAPTGSAATNAGLYVRGIGEGYELSATADTDSRLLILYLGGWKASANLEVSLSDASAQPLVINLSDLTGAFDRRVAINYSAGRDNERLILRYVMTGGRGNVTLQAAAMQGGGPLSNLPPVLDPIGDQAVLENQTLAFGVSARDDDGPAPLSLSASGLPPGASFSDLGGGNGQFTWTPVAGDATPAPYQLTFAATDGADASTGESIEIRVNGVSSGGSLVGAITTPSGTADLSVEGSVDWVKWAYLDVSGLDRKSGVTPLINDYRPLGKVPNRFTSAGRLAYAWIDGTPTLAASTRDGLYVRGNGEGFELSVSADTTPRTLIIYLGGWKSVGELEASLSDASAPPWVTSISDLSGVYDRRVEITFRASAPGSLLTLRYTMTGGTGNVTLQAAAMDSVAP